MSASKQRDFDLGKTDLKENSTDVWLLPRLSTTKISPDEQIVTLRKIFESVEDMMTSLDYDEDLQDELSVACPNYMTVFQTAKRDLLRNDCGIVVAGETSAGKTTLINQLVGNELFVTGNVATTGTITRIRHSNKLQFKCYLKDETLKKEEKVQDLKKLKSVIEKYTDINNLPDELKDIYYVDVKGNVIIVDTPGIGEDTRLDEILLDFLPHAVSFVFVVNARNAGGVHDDRLSKIMKTIKDNRYKMPCFDPRDVLFLTNQWDIIGTDSSSSDDGDCKSEEEKAETWNTIKNKIEESWFCFDVTNVFRVSLQPVEEQNTAVTNQQDFLVDEYNRFETVLNKMIDKNKNKRVEYYYRFLRDFIRNAYRGTFTRLKLLDKTEEEQLQILRRNKRQIQDFKFDCQNKREELQSYRTVMIFQLTQKLHAYLHSSDGREEILNPPNTTKINKIKNKLLRTEVPFRVKYGIKRWLNGQEVKLIIEEAKGKFRSVVRDIESQLQKIEIDMTEIVVTRVDFDDTQIAFVFGIALFPLAMIIGPILALMSDFIASVFRGIVANHIYDVCLQSILMTVLENSFETSFGVEYDKEIDRIFKGSSPNVIESMLRTYKILFENQKTIKFKKESYRRLEEKVRIIQITTEKLERHF